MKGLSRPGVREKIVVHPRGVRLQQIALVESITSVNDHAAAVGGGGLGNGPHPDTHIILVAQDKVGVGQAAEERLDTFVENVKRNVFSPPFLLDNGLR